VERVDQREPSEGREDNSEGAELILVKTIEKKNIGKIYEGSPDRRDAFRRT